MAQVRSSSDLLETERSFVQFSRRTEWLSNVPVRGLCIPDDFLGKRADVIEKSVHRVVTVTIPLDDNSSVSVFWRNGAAEGASK